MFLRYDELLMKKCLSEMRDIVYCARKACQAPVIVEEGNSMAFCHTCQFCFCVWCEQTYHGIRPCKMSNMVAVLREYKAGDAAKREFLERRYGVARSGGWGGWRGDTVVVFLPLHPCRMRDLVAESASMELIQQTTKPCPTCRAKITKVGKEGGGKEGRWEFCALTFSFRRRAAATRCTARFATTTFAGCVTRCLIRATPTGTTISC